MKSHWGEDDNNDNSNDNNLARNDTSNDEKIAWALAEADQQAADAEMARRISSSSNGNSTSMNSTSVGSGLAGIFSYPGTRRSSSNNNNNNIPRGRVVNSGGPTSSTSASSASSPPGSNFYSSSAQSQQQQTSMVPPIPTQARPRIRSHMCHVPCVIGNANVCVEMMVDTGAESSVISLELAKTLGLDKTIDRSHWGVAAGVGRATIIGKIRNVITTFGHVEFHMEFIVLDIPDRMLLLGMDQMRKYNCIINLQRDVLIFGGIGGVEVNMLPPDQQPSYDPRIGEMCTIS